MDASAYCGVEGGGVALVYCASRQLCGGVGLTTSALHSFGREPLIWHLTECSLVLPLLRLLRVPCARARLSHARRLAQHDDTY